MKIFVLKSSHLMWLCASCHSCCAPSTRWTTSVDWCSPTSTCAPRPRVTRRASACCACPRSCATGWEPVTSPCAAQACRGQCGCSGAPSVFVPEDPAVLKTLLCAGALWASLWSRPWSWPETTASFPAASCRPWTSWGSRWKSQQQTRVYTECSRGILVCLGLIDHEL